jgi:hypothetical protein
MRHNFCDRCYKKQRNTCKRPCKIVEAELADKGIYKYRKDNDTKKYTLELEPKPNEIDIIFMHEIDMELEWVRPQLKTESE